MGLINLYYIEGISLADTPFFNNINEQELYFSNHLVKSIEDNGWYPPYYQNEIKFESSDITLDSKVNYLSLTYNNKTYYYFIDDVIYINSDIILLPIILDSIQTYLFNTNVYDYVIERKFINRWNDNKINRNYIRENLSDNLFIQDEYVELNSNVSDYLVIIKYYDNDDDRLSVYNYNKSLGNNTFPYNEDNYFSSSQYLIGSYFCVDVRDKSNDEHLGYVDTPSIVKTYSSPFVTDMYICPFICFKDMEFTSSTDPRQPDIIKINKQYYNIVTKFDTNFIDSNLSTSSDKPYFLDELQKAYLFNFVKNNETEVLFDNSFCPVLLDENYIQVVFGSKCNNTTYPLYQLKTLSLFMRYGFDLSTGARYYYINDELNSRVDKFTTMVYDVQKIGVEMRNDVWKEYEATNRYRWLQAVGQDGINVLKTVISHGTNLIGINNSINALKNDPSSYTKKTGRIKKAVQRDILKFNARKENEIISGAGDMVGNVLGTSSILSQAVNDYNMKVAPDSLKQIGNNLDILSMNAIIHYSISKCNDYDNIGNFYHRFGYRVKEYVNSKDTLVNMFNYNNTRYYYNFIKLSNVNIDINMITTQEIKDDLQNRLIEGIRYWNINNASYIGDFRYDNVEKEYLQNE